MRSTSGPQVSGWSLMDVDGSRMGSSSSVSSAGMPFSASILQIDGSCVLHPFTLHKLDAGTIRLMTIAHAFNYRMAVLRDGVKSAARVGRSRKAEGHFLTDTDLLPGAYGRLLLTVYVWWRTGVLVPSDWLRPVTQAAGEPASRNVCAIRLTSAVRWSFGCWMLTDLYVIAENWQQKFDFCDCDSLFGRVRGHLQSCCAFLWLGTVAHIMSTLGHSSPIWAHQAQAHQMLCSHDAKGSIPMDMCSLGVVDLDLSISPDAFGLRAFDHEKPLTRMLPGSTPCELRLMLHDGIGRVP